MSDRRLHTTGLAFTLAFTNALVALAVLPALAQCQDYAVQRLGDVRRIYIDSLGDGPGAELIREKIQNRLLHARGIVVVSRPEDADAILRGVAQVLQGYHALGGHAESTEEVEIVVQLVSRSSRILWVYDAQHDGGGVLQGIAMLAGSATGDPDANRVGRPRNSGEAADAVADHLVSAIAKDWKRSHRGKHSR